MCGARVEEEGKIELYGEGEMLFEGSELDFFWTKLETIVVKAYFAESNCLAGFYGGFGEICEGGEGFWSERLGVTWVNADGCVDCVCWKKSR